MSSGNQVHRVFITGAGIVAPSGLTRKDAFEKMLEGISCVRRISRFDPFRFRCQVAAGVDGIAMRLGVVDRHIEMALLAADQAVNEACLELRWPHNVRTGVVFATAIAATLRIEQAFRERVKCGVDAFRFDSATELLAAIYGAKDLTLTVTTGCTASIDALGTAFDAVRFGVLDRAIVVTAEAPIAPITIASFDRISAISRFRGDPRQASRPFHIDRDGFVLGEGAAAVVLESERLVKQRHASPLARIEGWASVSSAYHMTSIRSTGEDIARAMNGALNSAGCAPESVDFLDLHATSTKQNDLAESNAVRSVFGNRISELPVAAQKSINGHALGASNLMEIVLALTAMGRGVLPPVANLDRQDPNCGVLASNKPVYGKFHRFLKSTSGFSGIHTCMVLGAV